jgi:hypothetical protein
MTLTAVLDRMKEALYPSIVQNALLDALLGAPADEIAVAEAKIEAWGLGGDDLEAGTVTVTPGSALVTLAGASPVTSLYQIDDDFVVAGSKEGNSGRYRVTILNSATTLTVDRPFAVAETGLFHARTKPRLLRLAQGLRLFPGGYESDKVLRDQLLAKAGEIHRNRGGIQALETELERMTRGNAQIIDNTRPLGTALASGLTVSSGNGYVGSVLNLAIPTSQLLVGDDITVLGSTKGGNGRYFVFGNNGTVVLLGRRAVNATQYFPFLPPTAASLQFREDREHNRMYFRVINNTATATKQINVTLTASPTSMFTGAGALGTGYTVSLTNGVLSFGWVVPAGGTYEGWVGMNVTSTDSYAALTVSETLTGSSLTGVRLGYAGLYPIHRTGVLDYSVSPQLKWGGLIQSGFRSGVNETGLTVYANSLSGFYLGLGYPGIYENDDYTMASPDDFVVVEVDHRNYAFYSEADLKALVRDHLIPADTNYVLGFV